MQIPFHYLPHANDLTVPSYATDNSAGMDLLAAVSSEVVISPGERLLIPTGLVVALPVGYEAQIRPRSGLAFKQGITVLNAPGTIDADYRGEIKVLLINLSQKDFTINRAMRIAQMVIAQVEQGVLVVTEDLEETTRGSGGFGSTGINEHVA